VSRAGEKKPGGGPGNTVRLFVALDLPDPVREQIAAWQAAALTDSSLRPMRPQALHVTLCFLSHRSVAAIPRIESLLHSVRPRRVKKLPTPLPKALLEPFGAVRVALYLSNLKPQGAEYERLAGVDLPSPTGQKR
jgi:2'-5' RNA ligase